MSDNYFDLHNDSLARRIAGGLAKLGTALRHQAWRQGSPKGLTPTQGQILTILRTRPGATLAEVSEALAVRPATASGAVATLESKGLVKKTRRPGDARVLSLLLTAEGEHIAAEATQWPDFLVDAIDDLEGEERQVLLRAILGMVRALQRRGEIPISQMCLSCHYFQPHVHQDVLRPHHCGFVNAPFGDRDLRLECPDHEPADETKVNAAWAAFSSAPPASTP